MGAMISLVARILILSMLAINAAWAWDRAADNPAIAHSGPEACNPAGEDSGGSHTASGACCHFCHASGHLSGMIPPALLTTVARRPPDHAWRHALAVHSRTWAPPTPPPDA